MGELKMIDEEKTFREKGYRSTDLSYGSGKKVWRICDICKEGRWVMFLLYRDLCSDCSAKVRRMLKEGDWTEKLPWIDDDITYAEKGYRSIWLRMGSHKKVWAICEDCGEGRWNIYQRCTRLCWKCANKKQHALKDEDKVEKLVWVDDEITFREKGYRSMDLKPGSAKFVWAICTKCGKGRWTEFKSCRKMCLKCSHMTEEYRKCMSGENSPVWKGGMSSEDTKFRMTLEYKQWRISALERDDYTCQECYHRGGDLNVHHILPYIDYKDIEHSLNIDNGITLCTDCHNKTKGKEYKFVERYQKIVSDMIKI